MEARGRRTIRIAAVALALSALAVGAVSAMAKKQSTSTKLKSSTSTQVSANRPVGMEAPIATTTATCPGTTKAVGGGFTASAPRVPNTWANATTWVNVFESQMVGDDSWRVSGKQFIQLGTGTLEAHVYCQRREKALAVGTASVAMPSTQNAATSAVATCPSGKALSGGFATPPPTDPNMGFVWSSFRADRTAWKVDATTFIGSPGTLTSYVYCGKPARIKERSATTPVTPPGGSVYTARPEDCPKKNRPFTGGFSASQPPMGLQSTALIYDSRRDRKSWIASAGPSNEMTSATMTSYSYCRRR